ncbi:hypothetical protein VNO77_27160 [Canavalia gladiata]|uniref:Uncharacterized protein n=1 Tax=Canavalia gladiata TaxID=3824 RepID=A0AAN9Q684_CANGL
MESRLKQIEGDYKENFRRKYLQENSFTNESWQATIEATYDFAVGQVEMEFKEKLGTAIQSMLWWLRNDKADAPVKEIQAKLN